MTERDELLERFRMLTVGCTVYAVKDGEIFEFETKYVYLVSGIYFVSCKSKDKTIADESFAYYEFGKIVFFTKEEAEAALKESVGVIKVREILFRGKTDKGEWVQGDLLHEGYDYDTAIREREGKIVAAVIPESVGQHTGLTDKNGKNIFEGDIVEYREEDGVISFEKEQAAFIVSFDTWCTDFDHIYSYELEVIGNIHDNPELLERGCDNG